MKKNDVAYLVLTAFMVAIVSYFMAGLIFKGAAGRSTTVPLVQKITPTFPDLKNDPTYSSFMNTQALDPTETIQIGNNQNAAPFSQ